MNIPYALPYIDDQEISEVISAIKSNWLSRGPKTVEFESEFAKYVDAPFAVGLNSCTAGLHLAQLALGIGQGDEVITSPYTFVATANTIIHCGAKPVFVDIDPVTMNLDPEKIEQAITPNTKAIIPVHFAGYPCEMEKILELARIYNLKVIEDAAHAVHTTYKGRPIGSISDVTCFSFYATKNLSTGEGGMVTTSDEEIADKIRVLGLHGMSKNAWNRYSSKGSWFYEVNYPGYKYNMTDIQAAFGLVQLKKIEEMQSLREKYAYMYNEAFKNSDELLLPYDSDNHRHAWHLYVIRLNEAQLRIDRSTMIELLKEKGIGTSVHFIPVPMHPYYRDRGYNITEYPMAQKAFESAISLPLYPGMTEDQVNYVIENVLSILNENRR
ncbi:DegT/DnrJ/EryC1/StrS family aminotransferase [Brevibacillus sp. SYSU BS000544]|uniref:DegT/DnrJ/EryC1/StrS family aminotransferase n=1 Tax=Brevibacillus sp. SYSU BS000544 TaxID=3416443 RepID=UPI003CE57687